MKAFIVKAKSRKFTKQAEVMEQFINQPSVVELVERRIADYFAALAAGKSEAEACRAAGLDPSKPAHTYDER